MIEAMFCREQPLAIIPIGILSLLRSATPAASSSELILAA
jgi:hypothetical protein